MLITAKAVTRYDHAGKAHIEITGSAAISYINNTDRVLYSAGFLTNGTEISAVTLNGAYAAAVPTEGGFAVPFLNELPIGESCELFIEFNADIPLDGIASVLEFDYDTAFLLTAYADSDIPLSFTGCRSSRRHEGGKYAESAVNAIVHSFGIRIG